MFNNSFQGESLRLSFILIVLGVFASWITSGFSELLSQILLGLFVVLAMITLIIAITHKDKTQNKKEKR